MEMTCYIIDVETPYNLLLGRPWIHSNMIVPSTLEQCFKYIDEQGVQQKVDAEKHYFKGMENYFIDSLLYDDNHTIEIILPNDEGSGNEADNEPDPNDDPIWEKEPLVITLKFAYESSRVEALMSRLALEPTLYMPINESYLMHQQLGNSEDATFMVQAKGGARNPIVFGKVEQRPQLSSWDVEAEGVPEFSRYSQQSHHIMTKMGTTSL